MCQTDRDVIISSAGGDVAAGRGATAKVYLWRVFLASAAIHYGLH